MRQLCRLAPDVDNIANQFLTLSSPLAIPAGATQATLSFWHRYTFEGSSTHFDGGVLEFSTDGGLTWADGGGRITSGGYNGTISGSFLNPWRTSWPGPARRVPTRRCW